MMHHPIREVAAAALGLLLMAAPLAAQPQPAETLPPPKTAVPGPAAGPRPVVLYSYPRVSRYAAWQNLGVDRLGRFRPLVIYSPYGAYYRYNHEPFPWVSNYSREIMPYLVDTPAGQ